MIVTPEMIDSISGQVIPNEKTSAELTQHVSASRLLRHHHLFYPFRTRYHSDLNVTCCISQE